MYLDDEIIGYARTNHEAEVELNRVVYERMRQDSRDLAPAANLYALYHRDAAAFWQHIASLSSEQRSEYAVLFAVYATVALNRPTTPEAVLVRWAAGYKKTDYPEQWAR